MSRLLKYLIPIGLLVVVGFFLIHVWYSNPVRIAERISGLDLPAGTKVLHVEKDWPDNGPDGHSVWVFETPEEFRDEASGCAFQGYESGQFLTSRLSVFAREVVLSKLPKSGRSCYRIVKSGGGLELVLIHGDKLVVFVSEL